MSDPCDWCGDDPLYRRYHDEEWGVPCDDDSKLFEFLVLESAQAGLNWLTILRKREGYRSAFAHFDPHAVAKFDAATVSTLLDNPAIVRNRKKVESAISNAQCFLDVQQEFGSFARYMWAFFDDKPIQNHWQELAEVPATTAMSDRISKDMKQRGFRFFGSTICYAHLQALGFVNDHIVTCPRHAVCAQLGRDFVPRWRA